MDKIYYLCDQKACEVCNNTQCNHTSNIEHAINFIKKQTNDDGCTYVEKEIDRVLANYNDFFTIKTEGKKDALSLTYTLKKKYQRALKKLVRQIKRVSKSMVKLIGFLNLDISIKNNGHVEIEVKDV